MRLLLTIILVGLLLLSVALFITTTTRIPLMSLSTNLIEHRRTFIQDLLETASDSRVRLSKLQGTSILGPISMWVAFPSSDKVVPGTGWYEQLWDKHDLGGFKYTDDMIALSPCKNHDDIFVQIGAHLGIFPLVATYRGCRGIAVEPMPVASNFTRISAALNDWGEDKFLAVNAVGSNKKDGFIWFDPSRIAISTNDTDPTGKVQVPLTSLDALNDLYGEVRTRGRSRIRFVVIDVEGHEQEVLLGAKKLIEQRSVTAFEIEVWTRHSKKEVITSFPGLQLLINNGYRLYTTSGNSDMNFASCDEFTNRLVELPRLFNQSCQQPSFANGVCLGEVFAVRAGLPPLRNWFSACTK